MSEGRRRGSDRAHTDGTDHNHPPPLAPAPTTDPQSDGGREDGGMEDHPLGIEQKARGTKRKAGGQTSETWSGDHPGLLEVVEDGPVHEKKRRMSLPPSSSDAEDEDGEGEHKAKEEMPPTRLRSPPDGVSHTLLTDEPTLLHMVEEKGKERETDVRGDEREEEREEEERQDDDDDDEEILDRELTVDADECARLIAAESGIISDERGGDGGDDEDDNREEEGEEEGEQRAEEGQEEEAEGEASGDETDTSSGPPKRLFSPRNPAVTSLFRTSFGGGEEPHL